MKVCENCGIEIDGRDGENLCPTCDAAQANDDGRELRNRRRRMDASERNRVMRGLGMVRVRGALGGVYWE